MLNIGFMRMNLVDVLALLDKIREPREAMCHAASQVPVMHSWGSGGEFIAAESAADIWRAMIDQLKRDIGS